MSVKRRGGDAAANYFYRFTYKGQDFCEGGFRTKDQAETSERKAKDLAHKMIENPESCGDDMTWEQATDWWLENRVPMKKKGKNDISMIPLILDHFRGCLLRKTGPPEIGAFLAKLQELRNHRQIGKKQQFKIGPTTRNHYRTLLHSIYSQLKKERLYRGENPVEVVKKIKVATARCRFIAPAEEKILTPFVKQEPDIFCYYRFGTGTGMRIGEMRGIRIKDVDIMQRHIYIGGRHNPTKGGDSAYVPLNDALVALAGSLMAGRSPEDYLLPNWGYTYLRRRFLAICKKAGIENLKIHDWRHTFANNMLSKGESIYTVSNLLCHSSEAVTQKHYGHLSRASLTEAIRRVEPFLPCDRIATASKIIGQTEVQNVSINE